MASSGWQGEQTVYNYSSNIWLTGDLRIDGITHSGTDLRVWGMLELGGRGTNGYYVYFNNGIHGRTTTQGDDLIVGNGVSVYSGQNYQRSFDVTINGVSENTTSFSFSAVYYACNANDCSSKYFDTRLYWNINFAASGTAPSGLAVTHVSDTWDSVTGSVTLSSYGTPSSDANRYIEFGVVDPSNSEYGSPYRYKIKKAVNSETFTVTNSDYGAFVIKGCIGYKVGGWATNTVMSTKTLDSTVRYTPPAPGQLSYTDEGNGSWRVVYTGVAANNSTSYTAADLVRTFRYKDSSSSTWTYVQQDAQAAITDTTISVIPISPQHTVEVEAWMTYKGGQSEVSSTTITNDAPAARLYGSVPGQVRNESAEIEKFYGSVNGQTKKIKKLYASVGGVTKLIFEDNS